MDRHPPGHLRGNQANHAVLQRPLRCMPVLYGCMGLQAIPASTAGRHHQLKLAHLRESARVTEARQPLGLAVAAGLTLS